MKFFLGILLLSSVALAQEGNSPGSNVDMRRLQVESDARKEKARAEVERRKADNIRAHYEKRRNDIDKIRGRKQ